MPKRAFAFCSVIMFCAAYFVFSAEETQGLTLAFKYSTGGAVRSRPAEGRDGSLYVLSEDRYLYAVDREGLTLFRTFLGERVADCLSVGRDGSVYCGLKDGTFIALNPRGGIIWRFRLDAQASGDALTLEDGTILVSDVQGSLYALSHSGRLRWRRSFPKGISAPPVQGACGDIFIPCFDSRIYRLSLSGEQVWVFLCSGVPGRPAVGPSGTLFVATANGTLVSILPSGEMGFSYTAGERLGNPVLGEDALFLTTQSGRLLSLDLRGEMRWSLSLPVDERSGCSVGERGIYVQTNDGRLFLVSDGGSILARYPSASRAPSPLLSSDGRIVVGGDDWVLYAFEGGDSPRGFWPQEGRDCRHSNSAFLPPCGSLESPETEIFRQLSALNDEGVRLSVLRDIEGAFESGNPKDSRGLLSILSTLVTDGTVHEEREGKRIVNDFPRARGRSAFLLGRYGGLDGMNTLLSALSSERDSEARLAIVRGIAELKSDPDGRAVRLLAALVRPGSPGTMDRSLALEVLAAIEALSLYQGALSEEGFKACFALYSSAGDRGVSDLARAVMLRSYR